MNEEINTVIAIGTLLAAFAAAAAAWAAWRATAVAKDAVRMQVLLDFAKRDASEDMHKAIVCLWNFRREKNDTGPEFAERFSELKNENSEEWARIDMARRIVHKFYLQLMQAKQSGLISDRELIIGVYKHQLETVTDILQPLETRKEGYRYTKSVFAEYNRLLNEYPRLYKKYHKIRLD